MPVHGAFARRSRSSWDGSSAGSGSRRCCSRRSWSTGSSRRGCDRLRSATDATPSTETSRSIRGTAGTTRTSPSATPEKRPSEECGSEAGGAAPDRAADRDPRHLAADRERTPVWPGDVPFSARTTASLADGSPYESTCFTMSAHLGTHVDAPSHVLRDGAAHRSAVAASLPRAGARRGARGPGRDRTGRAAARAPSARRACSSARSARPSSRRSPRSAWPKRERSWSAPTPRSIDPEDAEDLPVHRALLSRGVALLEGLALSHVEPGDYGLVAVPLAFEALEASPVRAVLIRQVP